MMWRNLVRRWTVCAVLTVACFAVGEAAAYAQLDFSVAIVLPPDGGRLTVGSVYYDSATLKVNVSGSFRVPVGRLGEFQLRLFGQPSPTVVVTLMSTLNGEETYSFRFPVAAPLNSTPFKTYVVDLFHKPTGRIAYSRTTVTDLREDPNIRPSRKATAIDNGLSWQLTTFGLGKLDAVHTGSLPAPDLVNFNERLGSQVGSVAPKVATFPTGMNDANKACVPLSQVPGFVGTAAWTQVYADALAHYGLYQAASKGKKAFVAAAASVSGPIGGAVAGLTATAYQLAACVKDVPNAFPSDQFEVCVGSVKNTLVDLESAGVSNVDLALPGGRALQADVSTGPLTALVDGELQDVFIRWRENSGCLSSLRPSVDLLPGDYNDEAVADWTTCRDMRLTSDEARTIRANGNLKPAKFGIEPVGTGLERLDVASTASTLFTAFGAHVSIPPQTACGNPPLEETIRTNIASFQSGAATVLGLTWDQASPYPVGHEVRALDRLLRPFELGTVEPTDLFQQLSYTKLTEQGNKFGGADGLIAQLDSDVTVRGQAPTPRWYYNPPSGFLDDRHSVTGTDPSDRAFDVGYTITAAYLNQILRERRLLPQWLTGEVPLTWAQLGLTPPGPIAADSPFEFNGDTIQFIDPSLSSLGLSRSDSLELLITPVEQPVVNMPFDPKVNAGESPVHYQLERLQLTLSERDHPLAPPIFRIVIGFIDPEFGFEFGPPGSATLEPQLSAGRSWNYTPTEWRIPGCQLALPLATTPTCSGRIMDAIVGGVLDLLDQRMAGLLADVPAPQFFDADGTSANPMYVLRNSTYTWDQMITLFGDLVEVPNP